MVGVGHILIEKLTGTPLDWQGAGAAQREKIVRQLADIMLEIERHPFDKLGSLVATTATAGGEANLTSAMAAAESQIEVQGLAQHSTARSGDQGGPQGPFRSPREALRSLVEAHLRIIAAGEAGTAENAVDVFLAHRFRLDILEEVWKPTTAAGANGDETFFLKHAEDKGDHILVNADFDIIGIIDWNGAAPLRERKPSPRHA
jgi:hypothetical protein